MISYHKNKSFKKDEYGGGFLIANVSDLTRISNGITEFAWSPIVWRYGKRNEFNFLSCRYAVLDFDDGDMSLEQALKVFCDINHIIGTTKSHQLPKDKKGPADRFRVLLELESSITDVLVYRHNLLALTKTHDACDKACKDAARFFWPCREIVSIVTDMDLLPILPAPPPKIKPHENDYGKKLATMQWQRRRSLGFHVDAFLKDGKVFGSGRNQACYVAAKKMYSVGISEGEAIQLLTQSPFDRTNFLDREIETAVKSAYSTTAKF